MYQILYSRRKSFKHKTDYRSPRASYKNGAFWLVAFHNKGGKTLKKIMNEVFRNVEDIEKAENPGVPVNYLNTSGRFENY